MRYRLGSALAYGRSDTARLSKMRVTVCAGINLKAVRIDERTGDLNVGTLAQIMDTPEMNRFIVKTWKEKAGMFHVKLCRFHVPHETPQGTENRHWCSALTGVTSGR